MSCSRIKIALASIALASAGLGFAGGNAIAATETVPFAGNVGAACALDNIVPGTLAQGPNPDQMNSNEAPGGFSGKIDVNCTGVATIKIDSVSLDSAPNGFTPEFVAGLVSSSAGNAEFNTRGLDNSIVTTGALTETMDVDLGFENSVQFAAIPDGSYSASVTISANPN